MANRLRIAVFYRAPETDPGAVERVYHEVSATMKGTAGLAGNELLHDVLDPAGYVVLSEWTDLAAFQAWDTSPGHRSTSPLDEFQDLDPARRKSFALWEVIAGY
ncbi:hypothetical protein GCM10010172_19160 [Paractinoplanes ferrugineus]|uniref:ABM domain-containing protein n=1 Tax=Paractinoplanes ferrugineus TaxID=113564 RepID=A0A919J8U8_9ACTN|nr:antibiotic biosynthesis monooxygenase family protein [Actinoplanes ferrugineus]GIE16253.1 hypothetical protein Afe05nite_80930 [Actinoplanes ferrugineus]